MSEKILVVGGGGYDSLVRGLAQITVDWVEFVRNPDPKEYLCVFFTGGEDVSPSLYGHLPCRETYTNGWRDRIESEIFDLCAQNRIPQIGVCRGLQFINVMNGGLMIQHVLNHAIRQRHDVRTYRDTQFAVNSLHHQMAYPDDDVYIVSVSRKKLSTVYIVNGNRAWQPGPSQEIEACYFPKTLGFGVQWHPEMLDHKEAARRFFIEHVVLLLSGDLEKTLKLSDCPTMLDIIAVENRKYKHRMEAAKTVRSKIVRSKELNHGDNT